MLKFIICDDNENIVEKVKLIVNKVMMPLDYDYKTLRFKEYSETLGKIIKNNDEQKIYILDVQMPNLSGIEMAERIRKYDWNSIIIMLTAYGEYKNDVFTSRLMVLDYINKCSNYEKTLENSLKTALTILDGKKILFFNFKNVLHRIPYDEILYIKAGLNKKSYIMCTKGTEYEVNKPLHILYDELKPYFCQSHRSYIVNVSKVKKINHKDDTITFKNGQTLPLLSQRMKKGFEEYVRNF